MEKSEKSHVDQFYDHAEPEEASTSTLDKLSPYKVLLHNDDSNPMDYVADTILSVIQLKPFESHQKMLEAHNKGVSVLLVTDKESAERYRDQLTSKGLTITIEPA